MVTIECEHRGIKFRVGPDPGGCGGIRWIIPEPVDHFGTMRDRVSSGAFYDDCEGHPEGAYAWAEASARKVIDKLLGE